MSPFLTLPSLHRPKGIPGILQRCPLFLPSLHRQERMLPYVTHPSAFLFLFLSLSKTADKRKGGGEKQYLRSRSARITFFEEFCLFQRIGFVSPSSLPRLPSSIIPLFAIAALRFAILVPDLSCAELPLVRSLVRPPRSLNSPTMVPYTRSRSPLRSIACSLAGWLGSFLL